MQLVVVQCAVVVGALCHWSLVIRGWGCVGDACLHARLGRRHINIIRVGGAGWGDGPGRQPHWRPGYRAAMV